MQNDAAFVRPVIFQLDFARGGKLGRPGTGSRFLWVMPPRGGWILG
jgi:hypothetical protein